MHHNSVMQRLSFILILFYFNFAFGSDQMDQDVINSVINSEAHLVYSQAEGHGRLKTLNDTEKEIFYAKRNNILRSVAIGLSTIKYGFGFGSVVKEKIIFWKKTADLNQDERSLRSKSNETVIDILQAIDNSLHEQAKVFVSANEFGFLTSAHLIAEGYKANSKGKGGIFGLGLSVGYNYDQKMLIIEIYNESEKFKSSMMPAFFVGGMVGKVGTYMSFNTKNKLQNVGETFYPPGAPGFAFSNANKVAAGMSTGLTIPPSPFGDILTYTNKGAQKSLVQIRISPLYKGYIRFNSSLGVDFIKSISKIKFFGAGDMCHGLFN